MKRMIVTILTVFVILLGTSFALNETAMDNVQEYHLRTMRTLLPGSENFTVIPYSGEDANITHIHKGETGYFIETVTRGYVDDISVFVGVSHEGKVTGILVEDAHETVGLGSRVLTDHVFLSQFLNKSGNFAVDTGSEDAFSGATAATTETAGEEIGVDAITGATVTSKAVVRCVNSAVAYVTGADAVSGATTWGG